MMHTIRFAPETKHACLLRHAEDGLQMTLTAYLDARWAALSADALAQALSLM